METSNLLLNNVPKAATEKGRRECFCDADNYCVGE